MTNRLIAATRGSDLALQQTHIVASLLEQQNPGLKVEFLIVKTTGDEDVKTALWEITRTGFFTSQVEDAIKDKRADFAVHSFKDLPTAYDEELAVSAVLKRGCPEDCLVSNAEIPGINEIPPGFEIGTSSLRRKAQLLSVRSDLNIVPLRGNVPTRVGKVVSGGLDAAILARAGLERLSMQENIAFSFDPGSFIPAPAQGTIAVQTRRGDGETIGLIETINDTDTMLESRAERQILKTLKCGCHAPVGAFAKTDGGGIMICAFVSNPDGSGMLKQTIKGSKEESIELARELAEKLLSRGAAEILKKLERK